MNFAAALTRELDRRRKTNPRYSLRAFSRAIGVSHSALSRVQRGTQRPSAHTIATAGERLRWSASRIAQLIKIEQVDRLKAAAAADNFTADARWLASRSNLSLDEVQIALHEALRTRRLAMTTARQWKVTR